LTNANDHIHATKITSNLTKFHFILILLILQQITRKKEKEKEVVK